MFSKAYRLNNFTVKIVSQSEFTTASKAIRFQKDDDVFDLTVEIFKNNEMPIVPDIASHDRRKYIWKYENIQHFLKKDEYNPSQFSYSIREKNNCSLYFSDGLFPYISDLTILESADLPSILAENGQIILHSSYIITSQGDAILFSGPSGIGKSTQAGLWEKYAHAEIINGDRCLIDTKALTANGIFYSGSSNICKNRSAPLRSIIMLEQSDSNEIHRLRPLQAFGKILGQSSYHKWFECSATMMTGLVAELVDKIPVYSLRCRPDELAVELLRKVLYENK